jgi:hypothetical protein
LFCIKDGREESLPPVVVVGFNGCIFGVKMTEDGLVRVPDKVDHWVGFSAYLITFYSVWKGVFKKIFCLHPIIPCHAELLVVVAILSLYKEYVKYFTQSYNANNHQAG